MTKYKSLAEYIRSYLDSEHSQFEGCYLNRGDYQTIIEALESYKHNPVMVPVAEKLPPCSGTYLIQDTDGCVYNMDYDECIDDGSPFGAWQDRYDPVTLGFVDSEWIPHEGVIAWCEMPELYEELPGL